MKKKLLFISSIILFSASIEAWHAGGYHGGGYHGGYHGGGYGYRTWWDPYYSSFGDSFSYPDYSSYSGRWRQCPQGSICPPYLSCNDPYCQ